MAEWTLQDWRRLPADERRRVLNAMRTQREHYDYCGGDVPGWTCPFCAAIRVLESSRG